MEKKRRPVIKTRYNCNTSTCACFYTPSPLSAPLASCFVNSIKSINHSLGTQFSKNTVLFTTMCHIRARHADYSRASCLNRKQTSWWELIYPTRTQYNDFKWLSDLISEWSSFQTWNKNHYRPRPSVKVMAFWLSNVGSITYVQQPLYSNMTGVLEKTLLDMWQLVHKRECREHLLFSNRLHGWWILNTYIDFEAFSKDHCDPFSLILAANSLIHFLINFIITKTILQLIL